MCRRDTRHPLHQLAYLLLLGPHSFLGSCERCTLPITPARDRLLMHSEIKKNSRPIDSHRVTILTEPNHNLIPTDTSCHLSSAAGDGTGAWRLHHA